jgi:hypothetical protein
MPLTNVKFAHIGVMLLLWTLARGVLAQETPGVDMGTGSTDVFSTSDEEGSGEEPDCE